MMNNEIRKRDDLREEGKLGELIKRLTNDPSNAINLQTLPSAEHGKLADPEVIQAKVNDYFHKWYANWPYIRTSGELWSARPRRTSNSSIPQHF
jgi:hypothetical protein